MSHVLWTHQTTRTSLHHPTSIFAQTQLVRWGFVTRAQTYVVFGPLLNQQMLLGGFFLWRRLKIQNLHLCIYWTCKSLLAFVSICFNSQMLGVRQWKKMAQWKVQMSAAHKWLNTILTVWFNLDHNFHWAWWICLSALFHLLNGPLCC